MKFNKAAAASAIALASLLALTACSGDGGAKSSGTPAASTTDATADYSSLSGTITAGGSSAQANAQAAWTAAFQAQATGVTINYDKSQGSGGGVTNWLNGSYDFAGTDAGLKDDQQTQSKAICGAGGALNLPTYLSGVAVIYNLPGVKLQLSNKAVADIFSLKVTKWNDPEIAADNPGQTLPDSAITVVSRADGSGTTANFTSYLSQTQPSIWTYPVSTAWPVQGTSGQQGGSGVVNTVTAGVGTIGYADHSSIGKAEAAKIQVGTSKTFADYSASGATKAFDSAATATPQVKGDLLQKIDYTKITDKSAYPIPLLSYDVVCTTFKDPKQAKLTAAYLGFVASETGQKVAAANAGSAPLPTKIQSDVAASLKLVK
ncbi:phosphate ABC transporter substrate-binding protein PstS [Rathayibacter sp. KR2-224]|uniref:phosphate ABC transporter substrate-binding protein PstS n=1 Tax=Rathayibacter sp. KR2-224 TaxID=3400913 RepID=UPI003C017805